MHCQNIWFTVISPKSRCKSKRCPPGKYVRAVLSWRIKPRCSIVDAYVTNPNQETFTIQAIVYQTFFPRTFKTITPVLKNEVVLVATLHNKVQGRSSFKDYNASPQLSSWRVRGNSWPDFYYRYTEICMQIKYWLLAEITVFGGFIHSWSLNSCPGSFMFPAFGCKNVCLLGLSYVLCHAFSLHPISFEYSELGLECCHTSEPPLLRISDVYVALWQNSIPLKYFGWSLLFASWKNLLRISSIWFETFAPSFRVFLKEDFKIPFISNILGGGLCVVLHQNLLHFVFFR